MDPDFAQRRRVFVAVAITAVAIPAAFLLNRNDDPADAAPQITLVGTVAPAGAAGQTALAAAGAASSSEVLGSVTPGYLDGTVAPDAGDPPVIRIPRPRTGITGEATFSGGITDVSKCIIPQAPLGATVTLTNLDNSQSVACTVVYVAGTADGAVVLSPEAFSQIADITEAPVPVDITWQ